MNLTIGNAGFAEIFGDLKNFYDSKKVQPAAGSDKQNLL